MSRYDHLFFVSLYVCVEVMLYIDRNVGAKTNP